MSAESIQGYLKHVKISGFRSLKDVSVALSPLTVLIGANGAGKSNFIKFFDLTGWLMQRRSLKEWTLRQGGAEDVLFMGSHVTHHIGSLIRIDSYQSDDRYCYATSMRNVTDSLAFSEELISHTTSEKFHDSDWVELPGGYGTARLPIASQDLSLSVQERLLAKKLTGFLKQCRVYQFHDTSEHAALKKLHDISDSVYLNADGGNLAAVLLSLNENEPKRLSLIERQIARVLPSFDGFVLESEYGKVILRWRHKQGAKIMGAHLTSDGSLRLFCLITLLNLPKERLPNVILLDEPELGLHPNAITLVAAMIRTLSVRCQIILATQSPYMVDCFDLDNIIVADLDEGATRLRNLDKQGYQTWLEEDFSVSDLWLSNVLGGQP